MPIPNLVYGLMVPFLCVVTLPLAIFAGITTTLAFSVLMFRVLLVYLDIAVSLVPQYIMGHSPGSGQQRAMSHTQAQHSGRHDPATQQALSDGSASGRATPPMRPSLLPVGYVTSDHRSPTRPAHHAHFASAPASIMSFGAGRRSRRSSLGGASNAPSAETITPIKEGGSTTADPDGPSWSARGTGSTGLTMLKDAPGSSGSSAVVRDFEGIGGWRLASDETGEEDDSDWANINSRLELPLDSLSRQQHHYRTPSGQSGTLTPGDGSWLMMKSSEKGRGESVLQGADVVERDRDVHRGPAAGVANSAAGSSRRASVSPNSSRVRIGQGFVTFTGVERNEYFPPAASPKLARKGS